MSNVGQVLRNKREELGFTLKDVEAVLSIRVKYLEALESGNYETIPGDVYVKGFLRNYANYLCLDAEEMVRLYKNTLQPSESNKGIIKEEQPPVPEVKTVKRSGFSFGLGVAVLFLIVAGAVFIYPRMNTGVQPNNSAPVPQVPAQKVPNAPAVPSPQSTNTPAPQNIKITMKATEECWVYVLVDGKQAFEGILKKGDIQTWQAKNKAEITMGNAGGVQISYNDQPQAPLGGYGDVVHKVYTVQ